MKQQITVFDDKDSSYTYSVNSSLDSTFSTADRSDDDLGNFYSRPIKIKEYQWSTSSTLFDVFDPWTLYFSNPRVINRVSNFNNLRASLCLKFLINGNAFHYGRIIVSYLPLARSDDFTVDRAFFIQDVVGASQRPHIYLDPTLSQGGTMKLPFVYPNNALSIPLGQWNQMGEITLHTLQALKHANGASDTVTISVFAWAEDVVLTIPTSAEPNALVPQMGLVDIEGKDITCEIQILEDALRQVYLEEQMDEYGTGPISKPASNLARVMGKLTKVPYIGNYAKATSIAAGAISDIAATFGYSRPPTLEVTKPFRPNCMGNLANTNMEDTCTKLSVDCKQELTIDPSTVGLDTNDELLISSIACRESFLTSFPWTIATPPETPLFGIQVSPMLWAYNNITETGEMHLTACGFAALPFKAWRGSMRYRFQIVASTYHKGRLKIVYDPHGFQSNEYNTNYTYIIDIAESKDFTVQIGWGVPYPFALVGAPSDDDVQGTPRSPANVIYGTGTYNVVAPRMNNGMLRVYVVNDLTTPNSTINNDIAVNVFASCGDDIQFRNPSTVLANYTYFDEPQMGIVDDSGDGSDDTENSSAPMILDPKVIMLNSLSSDDAYDHVFYGESIVSFRTLLKRYNRHSSVLYSNVTGERNLQLYFRAFPYYRGFAPNAVYSTVMGGYNYGNATLLNYLTPAYTAWRGGIRWKANPLITQDTRVRATPFSVSRLTDRVGAWSKLSSTVSTVENTALLSLQNTPTHGLGGTLSTNVAVNPVLEWETPFQEPFRFLPAKKADVTSSDRTGQSSYQYLAMEVNTNATDNIRVDLHCSIGEDFSLFFYTGPPIIYCLAPVPGT